MGNSKQLLLFFLLVMVKWEYVVSGYEVPMGIVSSAVLPSDDEEEVEETREPANVVMNEIPVQEHQEMIPHLNKESFPANRLLNLFDSSISSTNLYNSLETFLSRQNLSPGKTTRVEIIPPEGSKADFVNTLMGNLKVIVPKLVTNAPVSFKLSATRNSDDTLKKINLDIIVGPAVQETFNRFENDENPKSIILPPIDVDLSSEPAKQDIPITSALINGMKQAKPYIDSGKSSSIVLRISPPYGFSSNDEQNTIRRITRILNQLVPSNVRTVVQGRSSNYPDGTVRNIDVKISLEPIQQSNGGENIEIDLSSPNEDIQKTLRDNLLLILQDERSKRFNLVIIPPVGTTPESSENIANMVNSILLQLIPNRKPTLKYRISQEPNGYVQKIYVEIDIEPSNKHKNPIYLHFDVNLSIPNTNIREEILKIIPKVKNTLSQQPNEPVSFTMDIKPPKGATEEYVTETLKNVQETLLDVLPTHRIGVRARITKDSQGNIVNISVISNIEPTERNPGNELNFDLSKPERNLIDYLIKFTPQLKNVLGKVEPEKESATLTLNIQPPTGANDQFVRNSMNTVTTFLSKLLPDKEISVEAKASKDPNGNVISTSLFITSKPGATTEEPKNPEEITVDLSDPNINLDDVVLDIVPHLRKPANEDIDENEPRSYSLNLIPPKGSGIKFVQDKMNYIAKKLSKYLPNDKISVQSKITKDSDDNIVNVTLNIIAKRNPSKEKPKHRNTINLDLSQPDTDIQEQITEIIPSIKSIVQNQPENEPVEFDLDIQPPKGASDEFVKDVTDKIKSDLEKELPSKDVKLEPKVVKDDAGNIIDIILLINIKPKKNPEVTTNENGDLVLTLNLENPDSNVETEITNVVPYITENLKEQQGSKKPEKFVLKIIPPKKADNKFVKKTMEEIRNNLLRIYPDKKVGIKGNVIKDDEGNVIDVEFDVTLEPTGSTLNETTDNPFIETVVTSGTPTENQKTITVNLDKPGVNLVQEIMEIIPTIRRNVDEKEITNQPYVFDMNIVPPKGAKENFVRDTSNYIITALSQFFPKNKIGLKAKTVKDDQGNIQDVSYVVSIEPKQSSKNIGQETTTSSPQKNVEATITTESGTTIEVTEISTRRPKTITVNFDKPGVDLTQEIKKQLPTLKDDVEEGDTNGKPVTFEMNIEPPKGAKDDFVRDTSKNLITTLSHLFPNNRIGVKAKTTKDDEGNIIDISYVINILPSTSSLPQTTTPSSEELVEEITPRTTENDNLIVVTEVTTKKPKTITINFDKPNVDLTEEIKKQLPSLKDDVEESNISEKPVTFDMNIEPPKGAKDDFVRDTSKNLITTLSHLFPNNRIGVKAKTTEDDEGNIIDISYVINILPSTSSLPQTTTPSSEELVEEITPGTTENDNLIEVTEITTKKPKTITINFDKPDVDLTEEIKKQLPSLKDDVEESNISEKPVTFDMNIEPPKGAKDDFVRDTSKNLITTLSHLFPNNRIGVKAKTTKDDEGNIIDISYVINILPSTSSLPQTTTPSSEELVEEITPGTTENDNLIVVTEVTTKKPKTITINFDKPDVDLTEEIKKQLPSLKDDVEESNISEKPVTFDMNIEPPKGAKDDFVRDTSKNLITTLSHLFPNNRIGVKAQTTKDDEGNIIDISYMINILPAASPKSTPNQLNLRTTTPISRDFIEVTSGTTEPETLVEVTEATTKASEIEEKKIDIDLSRPGSSLTKHFEEILPNIIKPLKKDLNQGNPVTFNFDIEPPAGSTDDFIKTAPKSLLPILTKYFPNNKIDFKATGKKNSQGQLTDVVMTVNIEPNNDLDTTTPTGFIDLVITQTTEQAVESSTPKSNENIEIIETSEQTTKRQQETTTPLNEAQQQTVDVDLSNPDSDLPEKVEKVLPKIIEPLKKDLKEGKPVTFNFDIEPPAKTTEDFLKTAPKSLLPVLTKYFPYDKINVKTTAKKDSQGFLTDVVLSVTVEPISEQETTTNREAEKSTTPKSQEDFENIDISKQTTNRQEVTTPVNEPQQQTIDVDLSNPGSNLPEEVEEVLPKIIKPLKKDLKEGKPVTFNFDIEPPAKTTEDFLKTAPKSLLPVLTKYFPYDKINVKTTAKKDSQGFLTDVVLSVTVEPISEQETTTNREAEKSTTPKSQEDFENIDISKQTTNRQEVTTPVNEPQQQTIDVDLSNPGSNLPEKVEEVLPKIIKPLKKDLKEGKPVTFNFDIEPPAKTTEDFLKTAPKSLLPVLTKYFPYDKINVKTTAKKDRQGFLTDFVLSVTVEPISEQETTTNREAEKSTTPKSQEDFENIDISKQTTNRQEVTTPVNEPQQQTIDVDLSNPGSNLPEEVEEVLPKIIEPLKKDLKEGKPVTFNFDIEPPAKTTEDFLKTAPKSLLPVLTKYFPYDKINVKTTAKKDSQGFLTDVVLSVTVEPISEQETTTNREAEKSTTPKSQEDFENIDISKQTTNRQEVTTPVNEPQQQTIDVDLSNPGSNLPEEVEKVLPKIIKPLKKDLKEGKPVLFNFDIEPPAKTTEDFLKTAPEYLLPVLTKYFPYDKINVKTTAKKDSQGFLTDVVLSVTVEPISEQETTTNREAEKSTTPKSQEDFENIDISKQTTNRQEVTTPVNEPQQRTIDVDLSNPGSNLPEEVEEVLPKIIKPLKKDLKEGKPVTFNFDIEPPAKTTEDFLKTAPKSLLPVLTKYFPYDKINVKTTAKKDSQGFLTDVVLSVTVEPISEQETTTNREAEKSTTPKSQEDFENIDISKQTTNRQEVTTPVNEPQQQTIDVDLSNPGSNLPEKVEEVLPKIIKPLKKDLKEGKPVTFNFDIEPPAKTTEDFLKTAPKSLLPVLTKYFPYDKINVKTTAKKDSQGFLTDVVLSVTVEPISEQETTTNREAEKSTTPKSQEDFENIDISKQTTNRQEVTTPVNEPQQQTIDVDLSNPGSNLPEEVEEVLPKIIKPLKKDLKEGKPVTFNFDIEPPAKTTEDFLKTAPKSLLPVLTKYFPYDKINVKTTAKKDSQGFLTDVVLSVTVEPISEQETTTNREAEKATTPKSQEDFENIDISEQTTNRQEEVTTPVNELQKQTIDVDLSNPGSNLPEEVEEVLPKIIKPLKKDLKDGKPVTFNFDIEPPAKTTEDFLKTAPKSLLPVLTKYFPYDKINVKTTAKKDRQGFLTDVVLSVTVEPISEQETTTNREAEKVTTPKSQEDFENIDISEQTTNRQEEVTTPVNELQKQTIDVDLSNPGSNLPEEVEEVLPKIIKPLKKDLKDGKPVTFNFDIEPPAKTTEDFLKTAPKSLLPVLTKYFPYDKINVKTTAKKDSQGFLTDVVLSVTVEPISEQETTTNREAEKSTTPKSQEDFENIDISKQTTNRQEVTTPVNEPQQQTIDVDLSNPGSNLPEEVEEVLPKIIKPLKKDLKEGKPVTFNFDIEPPAKTTEDFLKTAPKSLLPVLTKYFPYDKINVKTTAKKDSQGFLTDVVLSVTVEPISEQETTTNREAEKSTTPKSQEDFENIDISKQTTNRQEVTTPVNEPQQQTIDVDLSNPGSNLPEEVEEVLPKIIKPLKKDLKEGKPVILNFNIEPPPRSTDDFLKTTPQSLVPLLSKYFPNNKISIRTKAKQDNQGFLTDVTLSVNIEPNNEPESTTPADIKKQNIDIDLSKPGSSLPEQVEQFLPEIVKPVQNQLNEGTPVTLDFNIEPPPYSTEDFLQTAPQSLIPILSKYFPNNKISLKTNAKQNDQGFLTDVTLSVNIEPNNEPESTTPVENRKKNIDIDLSRPDSSLPEQVEQILPKIIEPLKNELDEGSPVTLDFNIEPPPYSTKDFLQTAPQSLVPILSKYFPNNKISLKTHAKQNNQGFLTDVTLSVSIEPNDEQEITTPVSTKKRNIDIDLSQPDSSLPQQVEQILPKIIKPVKNELNEGTPVTLDFNIEPPPYSTKDFLQTAPQSLVPILSKYFPNNKISLKTHAKQNNQGFLIDVTLSVSIEPNDEREITTPASTKKRNIDIDLSQPDSSLPQQVEQILPKIIKPVKNELNEGTPVTLDFNIEPPPYSTKDFLQTAPQSLVPILSKYFPNNKISLKTQAKQNNQGFLTDVTLSVSIEPNDEQEITTPVSTKKRNIDIDLSQPDSSLPQQVEQILPKIIKPVKNELNEGTPVTLDFNIEPPPYSTKDFLQTAPQSLVPILSKYFPNNKISLKTQAKQNNQGFLTDVTLSVSIEPNDEREITTPASTKKRNIDIDLSQPDSSLPQQVEQILPKIIKPVKNELNEGTPVTLDFNIEPPPYSPKDFLQTAPQSLVPILSKYFPNNKISLKTKAEEDSNGFLTNVVLSVIIEPNEPTPTPQPKERNVDIDLSKPGTTLPGEMKEIMLFIAKPVTEDLKKKIPVTLKFNIEPPPRSTAKFLQTAPQSIVSILSNYFPNNKMSLKTNAKKNFLGYLSDVVLSITIEPSEDDTPSEDIASGENINIDLSKPRSSITDTVNNELPYIVPKIREGLNNQQPMTIKFNIQPPEWATQDVLQSYANSLMPILSSYFPNNQISVKAQAQKNSLGYLTFASLIVNIQPAQKPQEDSNELRINLDLSNQYTSISDQVKQVLPSVINYVQNQPQNGQPLILYFDIKLPRWASREYIKTATNYMERILSESFPQNRLQVQISNKEGYEGLESVIEMRVTLIPEYK